MIIIKVRRKKGDGCWQKTSTGWKFTITIGYDSKGNQIRKAFYGRTQTEVNEKYLMWKNKQCFNSKDRVTVASQFHYWLFQVKKLECKSSTFERYYGVYKNYILTNPKLSKTKLTDVTSSQLQLYYNELNKKGKAATTLKNINRYISTFFADCFKDGLINRNPCSNIKFTKNHNIIDIEEDNQFIFLSDFEQLALAQEAKNDEVGLIILLALCCGLRRGEILALQYKDFILTSKEKWININKSIKRVAKIDESGKTIYTYEITTPKTKAAIRKTPLPAFLINKVKQLNKKNKENKLKYGDLYCDSNLLFCNEDGTAIDDKLPNRKLKSLLKNLNINKNIHFHSLRHLFISNCINANIPPKTVASWVGHSDIRVTLNIYAKISKETLIDGSNIVNKKFESIF